MGAGGAIYVASLALLVAACDGERGAAPAPARRQQRVTDATGPQGYGRPVRRLLRSGPEAAKNLRATAECAGTPPVGVAHPSVGGRPGPAHSAWT